MEGALRPLCPPPPDLAITGPTSFSIRGGPNPCPLHQSVRPKHHQSDPRKQTPGGRHQIGIPAGFKSESAADFRLECVAGFVGIRKRREHRHGGGVRGRDQRELRQRRDHVRQVPCHQTRQRGGRSGASRGGEEQLSLRSIDTGLSNGLLEAINGNVQAAKRKAKGYRTKRNLKTIVYLIAGDVLANPTL